MSEEALEVLATNKFLRVMEQETTAGTVLTEAVAIVDPTDPSKTAAVTANGLKTEVANFPAGFSILQAGTFNYRAVNSISAGSVEISGNAINLRVFPVGGNASFNINGGDAIMVREYSGFDLDFRAELVDPVINWVSGTFDLLVQLA